MSYTKKSQPQVHLQEIQISQAMQKKRATEKKLVEEHGNMYVYMQSLCITYK